MTGSPRPLRSDARRNRERIVAAARAALIEKGIDVPIDDIARRADVGVGTIYRRFGDRDTLIRQVLLDSVDALAASAEGAVASAAPDILVRFAHDAVDLRLGVLAPTLMPVMSAALRGDPEFRRSRDRLLVAVEAILVAARRAGALRSDVEAPDFLLALAKISRPLPGASEQIEANQTRRLLTVLLDGLCTPRPTVLPGQAASRADLDAALRDGSGHEPGGDVNDDR